MTKGKIAKTLITLFFGFSLMVFMPGQAKAEDYILKRDTLIPAHTIIYDKNSNKTGVIKPDPLIPDNFMIYDKEGTKVGELKKDSLIPGQYILKLNEGTVKRLHFEVRNETDGS